MAPAELFSPDYATARARFREAAVRLGWAARAYPIGPAGPHGEKLTVDVAVSPAAGAGKVLVLSGGLHGVEGFFGSAVQLAVLGQGRDPLPLPRDVRAVLLHGLNPFGFAWSRRADEQNIDPNRNFLPDGEPYRGSPPGYARLNGLLNPRRPPARWDLFYPLAALAVACFGLPALKQAVATGQYEFPRGLFFGGRAASRTKAILQEHLGEWLGDGSAVIHLDFHTGLGPWGTYKLLVDYPLSPAQRRRLDRWFGPEAIEESDVRGVAYPARGALGPWCVARNPGRDYLCLCAEFGTYGPLRVLAGLRAENQAHHWGRPGDHGTDRAKRRLRELFCPASASWRTRVLDASLDLVRRALAGLAEET
jgi:hypothetical protein